MKTAARKQVARLPRRGDAQRAINLTVDAFPEQNCYKAGSPGLGTNLARTLTAFLPKGTLQGKKLLCQDKKEQPPFCNRCSRDPGSPQQQAPRHRER